MKDSWRRRQAFLGNAATAVLSLGLMCPAEAPPRCPASEITAYWSWYGYNVYVEEPACPLTSAGLPWTQSFAFTVTRPKAASAAEDGRNNDLVTNFYNIQGSFITPTFFDHWYDSVFPNEIEAQPWGVYTAGTGVPAGYLYGEDVAEVRHYSHQTDLAWAKVVLTYKKGVVVVNLSAPSIVYLGGGYSRTDSTYGATSAIAAHTWYANGSQIAGATGPSLTYTPPEVGTLNIQHRVEEMSGLWDTLTLAVSVVPPPITVSILGSDEVPPNVPNCFFTSTAYGGNGDYTYVWKKNGQVVGTDSPDLYISTGASDFTLTITVSEPGFASASASLSVTVSAAASESACNVQAH